MKREVFLAISIGFILGLVITFGIWTANKSLKNLSPGEPAATTPSVTTPSQTSPAPSPSAGTLPLTVTSPADETLTDKNSVTLSGETAPSAVVTIVFETGEQIIAADSAGKFSADLSLEGGYNLITVTAFDKDGRWSSQSLTVTYTTAKI